MVGETCQRLPARKRVANCGRGVRLARELGQRRLEPLTQRVQQRRGCPILSGGSPRLAVRINNEAAAPAFAVFEGWAPLLPRSRDLHLRFRWSRRGTSWAKESNDCIAIVP